MTSATLALEELLIHPRYPELAARLRALLPNHLVDQADAAADDASAITTVIGRLIGGQAGMVLPEDVPGWLRLGLLDSWVGYVSGRARTCRHSPSASTPQPVFAAAWRPDLITCGVCAFLLSIKKDSVADRTCDSCGHCCTGVEADDGVYPSLIQLGPLTYMYGTCDGCRPATVAATARVPHQRPKPRGPRGRGRGRR